MPIQIGQAEPGFEDPVGLMVACHRRIKRFLTVLIDLAMRRDGGELTESEVTAMEVALRYFRDAAPHHTADEERGLFPALQQAAGGAVSELPGLERDHRRAEQLHAEVDELGLRWLGSLTLVRADAGALQSALAELSELYHEHIEIEENRVFPCARKALSAEVLEKLGREMAFRRGVAYIPPTVQLDVPARIKAS